MSKKETFPNDDDRPKLTREENDKVTQTKSVLCRILYELDVRPSIGIIAMFECIDYAVAHIASDREHYDKLIHNLAQEFIEIAARTYETNTKHKQKINELIKEHPQGLHGVTNDIKERNRNSYTDQDIDIVILHADSKEEFQELITKELKTRENIPPSKNKLH